MIGVGDLVVCVDDGVRGFHVKERGHITIKNGKIYRVQSLIECSDGTIGVLLGGEGPHECSCCRGVGGWFPDRFRKVEHDKREACEDEFVTLINRAKQPEKLPMTEALSRFGEVPESFVAAEREIERKLRELEEWVRSTRAGQDGLVGFERKVRP